MLTGENLPLLGSPLGFAYIFYPNSSESETVSIKFQMRQTALDHFIQRCSIESDENRRRLVDILFSQAQQTQKDADSKAQIRAHALVIAAACVWGTIQDRQLQDCKKILQIIYLQSIIRTRVYQNNDAMQQICTPAMKFIDYYPNLEIRSAMQKEKIYEIIKSNATGTTTNSVLTTLSTFRHQEPTNSQSAPVISTKANTGK